jgi:hypothetical protein
MHAGRCSRAASHRAAYMETADLVIDQSAQSEFANVAAGLSVLAGIAASDAICCVRLGKRYRGEDHRGAAALLEAAIPDGKTLAATLTRLLDVKDAAHYGAKLVERRTATYAVRWAARLIERAVEELER